MMTEQFGDSNERASNPPGGKNRLEKPYRLNADSLLDLWLKLENTKVMKYIKLEAKKKDPPNDR